MLRKSLLWWLGTCVAVLVLASFGRSLVDSLLVRLDEHALVHRDQSRFASGVSSQVAPGVVIVLGSEDGRRRRVLADAAEFSAFARSAFSALDAARDGVEGALETIVAEEFGPLELAAESREPRFADWYFGWGTSYRLLLEAAASTLQHALEPSVLSLKESVAADLQRTVRRHYEEIVLQPEIEDALVRAAFARAWRRAHGGYLDAMVQLDQSFQRFVAEHTTHLDDGAGEIATASVVDWDSQLRKLALAPYQAGGLGAAAGAGGIAALTLIGAKPAVVPAATKAVAGGLGRGGGSALLARLSSRLAAPLATRAAAATSAAGTGSGVGSLAGGPLGATLGALTGVALDFAVNRAVEHVERPEFEREVQRAVAATYGEWRAAAEQSLAAALDVWFGDSIQLLASFDRRS